MGTQATCVIGTCKHGSAILLTSCLQAVMKVGQLVYVYLPLVLSWESCLLLLRLFRLSSILWVVYSMGDILHAICNKAQELAIASAKAAALEAGKATGSLIFRLCMGSWWPNPAAQVVFDPPTYLESLHLVPKALATMAIRDAAPILSGICSFIIQTVITQFLN